MSRAKSLGPNNCQFYQSEFNKTAQHRLRLQTEFRTALANSGLVLHYQPQIQSLGVQLSIDDFGTGYSSLAALKTFPVSRLKIDKSFISDLGASRQTGAVAGAVISLARKLDLRVIAEGVETDEQVRFLRENDCHEMQGFRFGRPLPAAELQELLRPA
jgi:EAL domain-containing protein (putative c-di-GMP-specific phosphodiesterase class I)